MTRTSFRERLTLDQTLGEYRDGDIRYLVMRPDVLMGTFASLPAASRQLALAALAESASRFGGRSVQAYREAGAGEALDLLRVMAETAAQLGWGRWSLHIDGTTRRLHLDVENSPFAMGYRASRPSDGPVCHAVLGIFSALAPAVQGLAHTANESHCAAQHGGTRCQFHMGLG